MNTQYRTLNVGDLIQMTEEELSSHYLKLQEGIYYPKQVPNRIIVPRYKDLLINMIMDAEITLLMKEQMKKIAKNKK